MFRGQELAVVVRSEHHVVTEKSVNWDVRGIARVTMQQHETSSRLNRDKVDNRPRGNSSPAVIEARPASNAVEIPFNLGGRQGLKLGPGPSSRHVDQSPNTEVPRYWIEWGYGSLMEHRPARSDDLSRG